MTTVGVKLYYTELQAGEFSAGIDVFDKPVEVAVDEQDSSAGTVWRDADPDRWVQILGVQNIPDLQTAPTSIDVTSLEDTEEQSEPGLISGSSLGLTMNYKEGVWTEGIEDDSNFELCLTKLSAQDAIYAYKIVLKNGRYFKFFATARTTMTSMAVGAAQQFTFTLYKRSKVVTAVTGKAKSTALGNNVSAAMMSEPDIVSQTYMVRAESEKEENTSPNGTV